MIMTDWFGGRCLLATTAFAAGGAGVAAEVIEVRSVARRTGDRCTVLLGVTNGSAEAAFQDAEHPVTACRETLKLIRASSRQLCAPESYKTFAIEVKRYNDHNEPGPRNARVLLTFIADAKATLQLETNAADGQKLRSAFPDARCDVQHCCS
jgi:hypothetical protein